MVKKLTDEMKRYISTTHSDETDVKDSLRSFGDRFGFMPTSKTLIKYKNYNEENPVEEHEEEDEGEDEGGVAAKVKD